MFDATPEVQRSEDVDPPLTSLGPDQPVPVTVIVVRYGDEKVMMQLILDYKPAIAYAASAFNSLNKKPHDRICFEAQIDGSKGLARIDERLWPLVAPTLPEVTLRLLPDPDAVLASLARRQKRTRAEARLRLITEIATSPILIVAAGDEYPLDINLISATVLELKRVIERKLGLPISQQQLYMQLPREDIWPAEDNDILASVGVIRGSKIPLGIKRSGW